MRILLPVLHLRQEKETKKETQGKKEMSKTGFCFTGEGARGSVQAGMAMALHLEGVNADFTIGISSGSVCAASYAHLGPRGLVDLWSGIDSVFDVFGINYGFLWKRGLLNQRPMEKIVRKAVMNDPICESVVVRMSIEDGTMQYVSNMNSSKDEFAEAVLGAVAITALVEDRNGWVDAGSRQIAPLEQCIQAGCQKIYVIMGRRFEMEYWTLPKGFMPALKMAYRALDVSLSEIMIRDIEKCLRNEGEVGYKGIEIHLVQPNETPFESVRFDKCKEGVDYGLSYYEIQDRKGLRKSFRIA